MFQNRALHPRLSVAQKLGFAPQMPGWPALLSPGQHIRVELPSASMEVFDAESGKRLS